MSPKNLSLRINRNRVSGPTSRISAGERNNLLPSPSKSHIPPPPDIKEPPSSDTRRTLSEGSSPKSSQSNLIEYKSSNCDQFITLMTGLDLKTKDQVAILNSWCGGLRARTRCISYDKCQADFKAIIKKSQEQDKKEKMRDLWGYLKKAVDNFLTEGPK